jgi:Rps23 Pro-64 3,4-dihydroxylase Tpa1-like proline 4-hydroxylase
MVVVDEVIAENDGDRPLSQRKSARRQRRAVEMPYRYKQLFYNVDGEPHLNKHFERIHTAPNIYLIRDFLKAGDLEFLDKHITANQSCFKDSFTDADDCTRYVSEERTSTFIHLEKGKPLQVRHIERKGAELIGTTSEFVEPLQVVAYTKGQKFDIHHDAGTLNDDGSVELVLPSRYL